MKKSEKISATPIAIYADTGIVKGQDKKPTTNTGDETMANMSYCRFQNTVRDLEDCRNTIDDIVDGVAAQLSDDELEAAKRLIQLCGQIIERIDPEAECDRGELLSLFETAHDDTTAADDDQ